MLFCKIPIEQKAVFQPTSNRYKYERISFSRNDIMPLLRCCVIQLLRLQNGILRGNNRINS